MKRNLLSVMILALLVVNIVLTSVLMFSVVGTNNKVAALVTDIGTILQLEVADENGGKNEQLNIGDIEMYNIEDSMTVHLKTAEDGKDHYCLVSVSLSINTKHEDYKKYGSTISNYESLIKGEIDRVIGSYTKEEAEANKEEIAEEILLRIQDLYGSTFIADVVFNGWNLS